MLLPLTPIFHAAVAARDLVYTHGWVRARRLRWPVVSVGNLSVGGSGKTPLVIRLAELLMAEGLYVDVLSRGYGRSSRETERVDPKGSAARFGDEPLLIARNANVPVFVAGSRFRAGLLAEQSMGRILGQAGMHAGRVHLLDDGFQHRQLGRAVEVVLVGERDFDDTLLPAGNLREPLSALRRATFLALRAEERSLAQRLRALGLTQPIWLVTRRLEVPGEGGRTVAFCGIARPEEFFAGVTVEMESQGGKVMSRQSFPDHHRYTLTDVERLSRIAIESRADGFLTTEKDAMKLDGGLRGTLERVAPLRVAGLRVALEDERAAIHALIAQLPLSPQSSLPMRE